MFEITLPEQLPAIASPIDLLKGLVWPAEKLLCRNHQWKAAVWQMMVNHIARTKPELELPAVEVVRVSFGVHTQGGGEIIAAVRPIGDPQVELVLVYLDPANVDGQWLKPRLICRDAVGDEFARCLEPHMGWDPINGTQVFAMETRVQPTKYNWSGTNEEYANDWLRAYNAQVDDPQQLPTEHFELVGIARPRDYHSSHKWRVARIRSMRSGIVMVLDFSFGSGEEIVCRLQRAGETGWSAFPIRP